MSKNIHDTLAERWGISRAEAKERAFRMAYGVEGKRDEVFEEVMKEFSNKNMTQGDSSQDLYRVIDCSLPKDTLSQSNHLTALGSEKTTYTYDGVDKRLLETFPSPLLGCESEMFGHIEITAPEFTSLCPKTGQPDFATIVVEYTPDKVCVESKSFKLYLGSFRQVGEFHEACVARIMRDLVELLQPRQLRVVGQFTPRGGIKFWPTMTYHKPYGSEQVF